jgi:hypothetical protein
MSLTLLNSCQIEKRHFRDGYNITSVFHSKKALKKESKTPQNSPSNEEQNQNSVYASSGNISEEIALTKEFKNFNQNKKSIEVGNGSEKFYETNKCDLITLKSGEDKSVKVIEVNDSEIKYKVCDNLDGPLFVTKKSDIFRITYSNGTVEVFDKNSPLNKDNYVNTSKTETENQGSQNQETNVLAIIGLIAGILAIITSIIPILGWFFGLLGFVLGLIAFNQIKKSPTKFKGLGLAKAAMICGGIGFVLGLGWFLLNLLILLS